MKRICFFIFLLAYNLFTPLKASAEQNNAEVLLQDMSHAVQTLNYELGFINLGQQFLVPLRYRHAIIDGQPLAQIIQMDGSRREIVQRGDQISYYEPGLDSFSLYGNHIVDYLPPIIFANFKQLQKFYRFIDAGSTHVGDHPVSFVRIISKDELRYNYNLLIDEKSHLPLLIDLLDKDNTTVIEQFRVVSSTVSDSVKKELAAITGFKLPPMLLIPASEKSKFNWKIGKIPDGFKEIERNSRKLSDTEWLESIMYSDGLFNFSVNVVNTGKKTIDEQPFRQGRRTVYTLSKGKNSITVIGELPFATAKLIAAGVTFMGEN
ncbi:sigma-E factor regulatory protein RseB [Xenorhabdus sp. 42]|uniref:sigma-E factor regulatory protein RseB n=1 Tax=Xenorhabdus szentirmaii TaxID=290112 RepID=UPI000C04E972|nr:MULTISPECIES: sigma-E factor regulatory protein RseB [Xenorhabdus]MBD2781340.1 sigma-E factor regulatory protein RseB [Xenorhabdus sp. 38]MBD2820532.1 sigma-E factor regulatory protein RseB [Xenorhabdus sp. 42]PHM40541.1 sigma E regulatory protein, MucB/RseB [Xenorhabdus szentirmaii]